MTNFEKKFSRRHWLAAAAGTTLVPHSWAQAYPDRPVKIIGPFAPGGPSDIMGRWLAQRLRRWTNRRPGWRLCEHAKPRIYRLCQWPILRG